MFCPKCGSQVEDGTAFCAECGSPLPKKMPQPQTAPQQPPISQPQPLQPPQPQPSASQQAQQQPLIAPQQSTPQPPVFQPSAPQKKRRWPIVLAACIVAAAAIAAVVVFVVLPRMAPKGLWIATKTSNTLTDQDGTKTSTSTHTLDEKGNVKTVNSETNYSDGTKEEDSYNYSYDEQGFYESGSYKYAVESKSSGDASINEYESTTTGEWTFGDNGMPTSISGAETDEQGSHPFTCDYEYGNDGHIFKWTSVQNYEDNKVEVTREFDDRGLTLKETRKDKDGTYETVWEYEYDESGKPIKYTSTITNTAQNKKLQDASSNLEYDDSGNLITENIDYTTYPDDGSSPRKSTATTSYEYTYVEDPTPWVAEIVRLSHQAFSGPY